MAEHPYPDGTRVRHTTHNWIAHRPRGTAIIIGHRTGLGGGDLEYLVQLDGDLCASLGSGTRWWMAENTILTEEAKTR